MSARRLLPALAALLLIPAATAAAAPPNDDFGESISLTGTQVSQGFWLTGATMEPPFEPDHFNFEAGRSIWFTWTPANTGGVHVKACDLNDAKIKVYTGNSLTGLSAVPSGPGHTSGCGDWHDFIAYAGIPYRIVIDHSSASTDFIGTLKIDQRVQKPVATFPSWPKTSGKTFKGNLLRTTTYVDGQDNLYGAFKCEIDNKPVYCDEFGPYLQDLAHGPHTFKATAMDPYGNWQDGWSTWNWNVDAEAPVVTVTSWATTHYTSVAPVVTWQVNEPGVAFKCVVDGNGAAVPCASPWQAPEFAPGASHTVTIFATDPYGNNAPPKGAKWFVTEPAPTTVAPITPVTGEQPPVTTTATTTPTTTPVAPPAGPCAARVRALTTSQRTIRARGMRVRIANPGTGFCIVDLTLRAGGKAVAKQVRPVAAGQTITVTLKPRVRVPRATRIRLVHRAR